MSDKTVFTKYHAKTIAEINAVIYEMSILNKDEQFLDYGYVIEFGGTRLAFSKDWTYLGIASDKKDASLFLIHDWEKQNA